MRLLAISDLHLSHAANRAALSALAEEAETTGASRFATDWLILAGDVAERPALLQEAFRLTTRLFAQVVWVPGNHELWTMPGATLGGEARYRALVALARSSGVTTPEDPYPLWTGPGGPCRLVPMFLLYDYSFRPSEVPLDGVVAWAREGNAVCADELFLDPSPHDSRAAWCAARCALTEQRLAGLNDGLPTVLINHFPLRRDVIHIPRVPRFLPWCGTQRTEDWHRRFGAQAVVSGHLHTRRTDWRDGTRFEEVSLGAPRQWDPSQGLAAYLREILPGPTA